MALRGQLLERPVVIPFGEGCLDGIYLRGDQAALLVASPLPASSGLEDSGGGMATPVGNELAYAAAFSGCASLRLDYRGVGASEGEPVEDLDQAAADLALGLDFLLETSGCERAGVAGYRSGAWAALRLALRDPRVDRLLLVAPDLSDPPADHGLQEAAAPTLIVAAGDEPSFNLASAQELVAASPRARMEVVLARRHFRSQLNRLARLVPSFLGVPPREDPPEQRGKLF